VRHPETDWNRAGRYLGWSDRPLTPRGCRQAGSLARRLARLAPDAIWSSGLARTDAVARPLAQRCGVRARRDPRWRELDHGRWEGLTWSEAEERFGEAARRRWSDPWRSRPHGGESLGALWRRVARAVAAVGAALPAGRAVVVTHAGPIQLLVCHALGAPLDGWSRVRIPTGGVARLDAGGGGWTLVSLGAPP